MRKINMIFIALFSLLFFIISSDIVNWVYFNRTEKETWYNYLSDTEIKYYQKYIDVINESIKNSATSIVKNSDWINYTKKIYNILYWWKLNSLDTKILLNLLYKDLSWKNNNIIYSWNLNIDNKDKYITNIKMENEYNFLIYMNEIWKDKINKVKWKVTRNSE